MAKQHKIKWREQDSKEIERVVKNFNAKISRLAKKEPSIKNILPEKIKLKEFKSLINTRQDLKRELKSLKRFSQKGAEKIVVIPDTEYNLKTTAWQKKEMNLRIAVINRKRKKRLQEIEEIEIKDRGKATGYTKGQVGMGKAEKLALEPMNAFYRTMGNADLKKRWQSIVVQSQSDFFDKKDYMARENYIKSLLENFNENDIRDIVYKIEDMDIQEFIKIFREEGNTFEMAYPDPEKERQYINALRSIWKPNEEKSNTYATGYLKNLDLLKNSNREKGYYLIYSNGEKAARFRQGNEALKYINNNKLENVTFKIIKNK